MSCFVTFYLFVLPAVHRMSGDDGPALRRVRARLAFRAHLDPRPEYHRGIIKWSSPGGSPRDVSADLTDGVPSVESTGSQCSSRLMSTRSANCLIELPLKSDDVSVLEAGVLVDVLLL